MPTVFSRNLLTAFEYVPAEHFAHVDAPDNEYVPSSHVEHVVVVPPVEYVPAEHFTHCPFDK